jgi:hypothetical protein
MRLKTVVVEEAIAFDADRGTEFAPRIAIGGVGKLLG